MLLLLLLLGAAASSPRPLTHPPTPHLTHPPQERLAKAHGSQCGFCTPGFVMSMYSLLRAKRDGPPTEEEIEENLAGNLW